MFTKIKILLLCGVLLLAAPSWTFATGDNCEPELTAVFLLPGIFPGPGLSLAVVHVREVGPATNPDAAQLLQNLNEAFAGDPLLPTYNFQGVGTAGNFRLYLAEPGDFGAFALVDLRDGAVVFAAQVVWMGQGEIVIPAASSHPWTWEAGLPAAPPAESSTLANIFWSDEYFSPQDDLGQLALDHIRQTDIMRSFGSCAPYQVTSFLHTPTVGATDPLAAVQVLVISGHAGPPWGPDPIDTTPLAWDKVKASYR